MTARIVGTQEARLCSREQLRGCTSCRFLSNLGWDVTDGCRNGYAGGSNTRVICGIQGLMKVHASRVYSQRSVHVSQVAAFSMAMPKIGAHHMITSCPTYIWVAGVQHASYICFYYMCWLGSSTWAQSPGTLNHD